MTLALENNGTYDAYGVQATLYSPDDTTTVTDNVVGGNGRVRAGRHVAVGSVIEPPKLWQTGAAAALNPTPPATMPAPTARSPSPFPARERSARAARL